jgi:hypothetical protein
MVEVTLIWKISCVSETTAETCTLVGYAEQAFRHFAGTLCGRTCICCGNSLFGMFVMTSLCQSIFLNFLKSITALSGIKYFCLNCQRPEMKC